MMRTFILDRAKILGLDTAPKLHASLIRVGVGVTEEVVERWLYGRSRPQGDRLEGLLDVLGVYGEHGRAAVRKLT